MFMKHFLTLTSVAGLAILTACSSTPAGDNTGAMSSSSSAMMSSDSSLMMSDSSSSAMMQSSSSANTVSETKVIAVTAANFTFTPNVIRIKKGDKIQLKLVGSEGMHGLAVDGLGINVKVSTGDTVMVDIPTDTTGTFSFRCSVPCGPGHKEMVGTIVIE